jgi:hypothetical protein
MAAAVHPAVDREIALVPEHGLAFEKIDADQMEMRPARCNILESFDAFRQELDSHNDRRERLMKVRFFITVCVAQLQITAPKLSRDTTNLSKKIIFLLHRIATEEIEDERSAIASAIQQSREKFAEIMNLFEQMRVELEGENFWRYQKTVSSGVQEYIEALSFAHYLEHKTLVTFGQVQKNLKSSNGAPVR